MPVKRAKKLQPRCLFCSSECNLLTVPEVSWTDNICVKCFEENVWQSYLTFKLEQSHSSPFVPRTIDNYYDSSNADFHSTRIVASVNPDVGWTNTLRHMYRRMRPDNNLHLLKALRF